MSAKGRPGGRTVDAAGLRLAIVGSRWHPVQADTLVARALAAAAACRVSDVAVVRVDGAWELPIAALAAADSADVLVAVGCIVRGGTPHFDYLCASVYDGLLRVSLDTGIPLGNGVLTCDTPAQAADRAGGPQATEDKAWDATVAALDAALTMRGGARFEQPEPPATAEAGRTNGGSHPHRMRRRPIVHSELEA
jgi:6,7-dimethyl-8-ribityllumazine synthase